MKMSLDPPCVLFPLQQKHNSSNNFIGLILHVRYKVFITNFEEKKDTTTLIYLMIQYVCLFVTVYQGNISLINLMCSVYSLHISFPDDRGFRQSGL